ncbi:DUF2249 domain-containing protein [Amphritea balenae]|uniref:DUF2249 domain-containing protein n=1 Tax=Amphritea balenae TaxID=452629 RepID=A0A3P1SPA8_9GAMM|nr:DUF2249 domain-containing protein [Amphritea balenae]RRC98062.1 DUF2249 domain-containing protein [Amphritea balenae]GGK67274.1 hypothetical protein GCM10007941_16680 [Amphritea balenae]
MPQLIHLDVSELEAPEPMSVILRELHQLKSDTALRIRHRKRPLPLYSLLQEMGFTYHCVEFDLCEFAIYIWPKNDHLLGEFCHQSAKQEQAS